jgi:hypothetical protein
MSTKGALSHLPAFVAGIAATVIVGGVALHLSRKKNHTHVSTPIPIEVVACDASVSTLPQQTTVTSVDASSSTPPTTVPLPVVPVSAQVAAIEAKSSSVSSTPINNERKTPVTPPKSVGVASKKDDSDDNDDEADDEEDEDNEATEPMKMVLDFRALFVCCGFNNTLVHQVATFGLLDSMCTYRSWYEAREDRSSVWSCSICHCTIT